MLNLHKTNKRCTLFCKRDILEVDAPAKRSAQKKVSLVFNKDRNLKETNVDGCSKVKIR